MIEDKTIELTDIDASNEGLAETITVPNGELWYVESFRMAGNNISRTNYSYNAGIRVETVLQADAADQSQVSNNFKKSVDAADGKINMSGGGSLDTYVSGGVEEIQVTVIDSRPQYPVTSGTYVVVIKARRVL